MQRCDSTRTRARASRHLLARAGLSLDGPRLLLHNFIQRTGQATLALGDPSFHRGVGQPTRGTFVFLSPPRTLILRISFFFANWELGTSYFCRLDRSKSSQPIEPIAIDLARTSRHCARIILSPYSRQAIHSSRFESLAKVNQCLYAGGLFHAVQSPKTFDYKFFIFIFLFFILF